MCIEKWPAVRKFLLSGATHTRTNYKCYRGYLGGFAKLRKATITFVMSVCLSVCPYVRMEQIVSHWTGFHEIWYLNIFRISVEKIQVFLKSEKNKRVLNVKTSLCFVSYLTRFLSELEMIQRIVVEKIKTYFILNDLSPLPKIVPFII